jgi:hypothetical protein
MDMPDDTFAAADTGKERLREVSVFLFLMVPSTSQWWSWACGSTWCTCGREA